MRLTKMSKSTPINQLPPSTPGLAPEPITEDDATIQDMLNNLSQETQPQQPTAQQQLQFFQQQQQLASQYQQPQSQQYMPQQDELLRLAALNNLINQQPPASSTFQLAKLQNLFAGELKLAGLIFAVVLIVHFIPFHQYIGKYFAIEKIPYHDILLRAMFAAFLVIIVKKLVV